MIKFRDEQQREDYEKTLLEQQNYVPSPTFLDELGKTWALEHPMILNLFGFIIYQSRYKDPSALLFYKSRGPKWMQEESNGEVFAAFIDILKKRKLIDVETIADYNKTYDRVSMTSLAYQKLVEELALGYFNSGWFSPYYGFWNTYFIADN